MTVSTSRLAYKPHLDLFQRALDDPKGVRVEFDDASAAWRYRLEMNYARSLDRKENREIYDEGDPLYGVSIYDPIAVTIEHEDDKVWLYVRKKTLDGMNIESLSEVEGTANG